MLPTQLVRNVSKDTKVSQECYDPENKRNGWTITMELNYTELNYSYFGDEADSEEASKDSDEGFVL